MKRVNRSLVAAMLVVVAGSVALGLTRLAAGPAPQVAASLPLYVTPADFGAVGNGKDDDTAALQRCIDATPDMGCVLIPPQAAYAVSAPLSIFSRDGLAIRSLGSTDTAAIGRRGAEFIWRGPAGAGALFDVN